MTDLFMEYPFYIDNLSGSPVMDETNSVGFNVETVKIGMLSRSAVLRGSLWAGLRNGNLSNCQGFSTYPETF
jgi:hypothetical protein